MKILQVLFVILLSAAAADGQSFHGGRCPKPSVQEDFNVTKYMGTWYEIEKLPAMFERGTCVQATYTLLADGTVKVHNAELLSNGKVNSIEAVAKVMNSSQPAILGVSFFKDLACHQFGGGASRKTYISHLKNVYWCVPDSFYWVLSTDYESYALVYSCADYFGLFHIDFAWILARTRVLTEELISQLHEKLAVAGVDVNRLLVSNQTGCDVMT